MRATRGRREPGSGRLSSGRPRRGRVPRRSAMSGAVSGPFLLPPRTPSGETLPPHPPARSRRCAPSVSLTLSPCKGATRGVPPVTGWLLSTACSGSPRWSRRQGVLPRPGGARWPAVLPAVLRGLTVVMWEPGPRRRLQPRGRCRHGALPAGTHGTHGGGGVPRTRATPPLAAPRVGPEAGACAKLSLVPRPPWRPYTAPRPSRARPTGQAAATAHGHSGGHARHPVALAPSELPATGSPLSVKPGSRLSSGSLKAQRVTGKYGLFMGFTEQPLSKQGQKPRRACGGQSAPHRAGSPHPRPFVGGRHPAASAPGSNGHSTGG